jgi:hypothetical protein
LSCASITYVEIEETCPFLRRGRDHRGLGEISTRKKTFPPLLKNQILKGKQNEYLRREFTTGGDRR